MHEKALDVALDRVLSLERLSAVFQPIISVNRQDIFGYEGLIRGPAGSPLESPDKLFAAAQKFNRHVELDYLCRKIVIRQFARLKLPGRLFINVSPASIGEEDFIHGQTLLYLQNYAIDPNRVVIEITETHPIRDESLLQQALGHYRDMGFQVALDDLGAGYAGLKLWSEMNPNFVKIDRHFIQKVDRDKTKRRFISSILEIAESLGSETITEGVETQAEYDALRRLGVKFSQGFYFARPAAQPVLELDPSLFNAYRPQRRGDAPATLHRLLQFGPILNPDDSIADACLLFSEDPDLQSIPVIHDGEALGLLRRPAVGNFLDRRRRPVAALPTRPVRDLVDPKVLSFDLDTPLTEVSRALTNSVGRATEEFLISESGRFLGKGSILDLLREITEMFSRPHDLTGGLGRSAPFRKMLERYLDNRRSFVVIRTAIVFNAESSTVVNPERSELLSAKIITAALDPSQDYVGDLGDGRQVALVASRNWKQRCLGMLSAFAGEWTLAGLPAGVTTVADSEIPCLKIAALIVAAESQRPGAREIIELSESVLQRALESGRDEPHIESLSRPNRVLRFGKRSTHP